MMLSQGRNCDGADKLPGDVVGKVLEYLKFDEISRCKTTCTLWNSTANESFFRRELHRRSNYLPQDFGMGKGSRFTVPSPQWQRRIIAWQQLADVSPSHLPAVERVRLLSTEVNRRVQLIKCETPDEEELLSHLYTWEACRWICTVFDEHNQTTGNVLSTPRVEKEFLERILKLGQRAGDSENLTESSRETLLLICKCIGILAIDDKNRQLMTDFVKLLLHILKKCMQDSEVVGNAVWALVILGRPLGGVEGEAYQCMGTVTRNYKLVIAFANLDGLALLFEVMETHRDRSDVLAKCFWFMVNLALVEGVKLALLRWGALDHIKQAMQSYPSNERLQYRACFALINIAIKREAKVLVQNIGLIPLIIKAAERFPRSILIQRTYNNVVRSLISQAINSGVTSDIRRHGGVGCLERIVENFRDHSQLVTSVVTTLEYLAAF